MERCYSCEILAGGPGADYGKGGTLAVWVNEEGRRGPPRMVCHECLAAGSATGPGWAEALVPSRFEACDDCGAPLDCSRPILHLCPPCRLARYGAPR